MGLTLNNRVLADARLQSIHGQRIAGGYRLRLSIEFTVHRWALSSPPPHVLISPARVALSGQPGLVVGIAHAESNKPFSVDEYSNKTSCLFDLDLTPSALESIERHRNGLGVSLSVGLHAQVFAGPDIVPCFCDVTANLNQSQWIDALNQAGFGNTVLFEVPIPSSADPDNNAVELLAAAQRLLLQGHYAEVVAKCRMALERLTQELQQGAEMERAKTEQKIKRTLSQRELLMRQASIDFASLAHHPTDNSLSDLFDRNAALMMLGTTAALVSSALHKHERVFEPQG